MRCATVSSSKKMFRRPLQAKPREGTNLRRAYDLLQDNKGTPVDFSRRSFGNDPNLLNKLEDFYGLDIRLIKQGYKERLSTYILAGEWFGRAYIDYIAERLEAEKRKDAA